MGLASKLPPASHIVSNPPAIVEIVDSRDDAKYMFVIVNGCKIKIDKKLLNNEDKLVAEILTICGD